MRMSSSPPSTITSASPSFWQVMPLAPAATCILASTGLLCVLMCGRLATPAASHSFCTRAMLASTRSRSITTAGVPNSRAIWVLRDSMLIGLSLLPFRSAARLKHLAQSRGRRQDLIRRGRYCCKHGVAWGERMEHATQVALTRRVLDFVDRNTTELAEAVYLNPDRNLHLPQAGRARARAAVSRPSAVLRAELRAGQARRLARRRSLRRAGPGRARRRRAAARLPQRLPASRRQGRDRLRLGQAHVRVPLSRLHLRSRGPADEAPRRGLSRAHLRGAQPGADPRRGEAWPDLGAGLSRRRHRRRRAAGRPGARDGLLQARRATATTRPRRSPRT